MEKTINYKFQKTEKDSIVVDLSIKKDSMLPEFDIISKLDMKMEGFEDQKNYLKYLLDKSKEAMGMFVDDALKIRPIEILEEFNKDLKPWDKSEVFPLTALKNAIYKYLEEDGQLERLKYYTTEIVCACKGVSNHDIEKAKGQFGPDFEKIVKSTKATTGCGSCVDKVKKIINNN